MDSPHSKTNVEGIISRAVGRCIRDDDSLQDKIVSQIQTKLDSLKSVELQSGKIKDDLVSFFGEANEAYNNINKQCNLKKYILKIKNNIDNIVYGDVFKYANPRDFIRRTSNEGELKKLINHPGSCNFTVAIAKVVDVFKKEQEKAQNEPNISGHTTNKRLLSLNDKATLFSRSKSNMDKITRSHSAPSGMSRMLLGIKGKMKSNSSTIKGTTVLATSISEPDFQKANRLHTMSRSTDGGFTRVKTNSGLISRTPASVPRSVAMGAKPRNEPRSVDKLPSIMGSPKNTETTTSVSTSVAMGAKPRNEPSSVPKLPNIGPKSTETTASVPKDKDVFLKIRN